MRLRSLVAVALGAGLMLSAAAPAFADRDDHGRRDWHADRGWHADRDHRDWQGGGYYAPPVVVAPTPAYGYYAPPPVVYGPSGVGIDINIR